MRPMLVIPIWINSLLANTCRDQEQAQKVKEVWDELAEDFLNVPFVRSHDQPFNPLDRVDKLELALKFSKKMSLQIASRLVAWARERGGESDITYHQTAFSEPAFINRTAKYIVHGHTHHHEIVPLRSSILGGKRFEQMYLNSGTWRRVHELARFRSREQAFQGYHEMTYFAFYRDGERKGRPFEVWSGTLGVR